MIALDAELVSSAGGRQGAISLVLSQQPLQGKAILEQFKTDVQSTGFPADKDRLQDYVEQHYIERIRKQNIKNLGIVLAKTLLSGEPAELEPYRQKIILSLKTVRDRAQEAWTEIETDVLKNLNATLPDLRARGIAFIAAFPEFWGRLNQPIRTAFLETVQNLQPENVKEFCLLSAVVLPEFRDRLLILIEELSADQLEDAIRYEPLDDLWRPALDCYESSSSYRNSEDNFRSLIVPFADRMDGARYDEMLEAIMSNGQNWNASGTAQLLLSLLKNTDLKNFPTTEGRDAFVHSLRTRGAFGDYNNVLELFKSDGWEIPARQPATDDDD